jgi:uncharacterized protein (DUF1810 family)
MRIIIHAEIADPLFPCGLKEFAANRANIHFFWFIFRLIN